MTPLEQEQGVFTRAIHAGERPDPATGAIAPPIYQTATFGLDRAETGAARFAGQLPGYIYTRIANPTQTVFEEKMATLEGGEAALATATGMAAINALAFSLLRAGDHLLASDALYGSTYDLFAHRLPGFGIATSFVDATDLSAVERALRPETRLLFVESPGNPTLAVADIQALAALTRPRGTMLAVDNTFATPINQRPLALGADLVVHSATKYIGGHGDALGGVLVGASALVDQVHRGLNDFGGTISPFNAWLLNRGAQTLPLRVARHNENGLAIAQFLEGHPAISWVHHPGLASHPQHAVARRQMKGFGGMIAFELKGGLDAGRGLMNAVRLCTLAVSLGDVRTLISHPASMSHAKVPRERRVAAGISDGLVRLSVGLEDAADLIGDLGNALEVSQAPKLMPTASAQHTSSPLGGTRLG
ncbi:MAG: PLP-dependent transferase [Chloroflexi bacterium]|nr:PLP-dependent transferase [Chloroflexota bacterium]